MVATRYLLHKPILKYDTLNSEKAPLKEPGLSTTLPNWPAIQALHESIPPHYPPKGKISSPIEQRPA